MSYIDSFNIVEMYCNALHHSELPNIFIHVCSCLFKDKMCSVQPLNHMGTTQSYANRINEDLSGQGMKYLLFIAGSDLLCFVCDGHVSCLGS